MTTISIVPDPGVLLQPILPTRVCKNYHQFYDTTELTSCDTLSEYFYIQLQSSDTAYFFVLDFDIPNALEVIAQFEIQPFWIVESVAPRGRAGHAQCAWRIHPESKVEYRRFKTLFHQAFQSDSQQTDSLVRNPWEANAKVTWGDPTPRLMDELAPQWVKDLAYDNTHGTTTERLRTPSKSLRGNRYVKGQYSNDSRSYGDRTDYRTLLATTQQGNRNDYIFRAIRTEIHEKKITDIQVAEQAGLALNNLFPEPLEEYKIKRTVRNIMDHKDEFSKIQSKRAKTQASLRIYKSDKIGWARENLHQQGYTWKQIADMEGVTLKALEKAQARYRKRNAEMVDPETGEVLNNDVE